MPVDTILYNTKVYFRGNLVEAGIAIDDGKIVKIAKQSNLPNASNKINLNGNITLPGLIDVHVHLRDQELSYKETFATGTAAAAAGGVTSVIDMPNNKPVTMDSSSLRERIKAAENQILVNVGFHSAFPKDLAEVPEIVKTGAIGFKVYLASELGGVDVADDSALLMAFHVAAKNKASVSVHAEDRTMIQTRKKELESTRKSDLDSYVSAHSPEAEAKSIRRIVNLIKNSKVSIHFCHLSSELGLNEIMVAKNAGLPVTCEVTPHNLFLSSEQYVHSGTFALTDPPLRQQKDHAALLVALKQGLIDVIASDHAPHSLAEKTMKSVWDVSPGVPGLETTLSLLLNQINNGRLSFTELVRITAESPAKIFHLANRGFLDEGNWADLVVVDMNHDFRIDSSLFYSKAKYSPFDGMHVKGKPIMTFANGTLVMDDGAIISGLSAGALLR